MNTLTENLKDWKKSFKEEHLSFKVQIEAYWTQT